jgi:predicted GNAT family acetyltransferase
MDVHVTVADAPQRHRFEAYVGGRLAGFASYIRHDRLVVLTHTEVEPAFEGHGVGSALARAALDDAVARGVRVRPYCPFVAGWIARHPAYAYLAGPAASPGSLTAQREESPESGATESGPP